MGLFSNKNKRDRAAQDDGRFYSKDDDAAIGERARAKRASHAGATANAANGGASARRSANDPLLPEKKRARRRLVGAIALALAAAVGLPMLLDSAPKPLAGDIAIQIPSKDKAAPLPVPAAPADASASSGDADDAPVTTEKSADKPTGKPAAKAVPKTVAPVAAMPSRPKTVAAADSVDQGEEVIAPPPKPAVRKPEPKPAADVVRPEPKDTRAERIEKAERDRAQHEKAAHDRAERERADHERADRERAEKAQKAREAREAERLVHAREKAAAEDHPKAVPDKPVKHDDASRAMAILQGKGGDARADAKHDDAKRDDAKHDDAAPAPKSTIQVAAMSSQEKAAELQARLSAAGIGSYTEKAANGLIRVKVGPLAHDDADRVRAKLGKLGL